MNTLTKSEQQRLFFALSPDTQVRQALQAVGRRVVDGGGRPVHADDLHMTLVFLGQVGDERLPDIQAVADGISMAPFDLCIDRFGWWKRSGTLWCAPSQVPDVLPGLFSALQTGLADCGFPPERRPYRPHVTLVRKVIQEGSGTLDRPVTWPVNSFVLMASRTWGAPPRYRVLKKWPADS